MKATSTGSSPLRSPLSPLSPLPPRPQFRPQPPLPPEVAGKIARAQEKLRTGIGGGQIREGQIREGQTAPASTLAGTTSSLSSPLHLDLPQPIRLSPDLALALEDQWVAAGGGRENSGCKPWREWLEEYVNQALQAYLGIY